MIDWQQGTWRREPAPAGRAWRLTVAADWAPIEDYGRIMASEPERIYGDLLPELRSADLAVVNVEVVLGNAGSPIPKSGPNLRGPEAAVNALSAVPFHVACMANNHAMDYGREGLQHTLSVLRKAGLRTVGAGMSGAEAAEPLLLDVGGVRFGIVNCAEGEEARSLDGGPGVHGLDAGEVGAQIAGLKGSGRADVVLAVVHAGREYAPVPPPYVVDDLRRIADAGADAVVAHHPHVPQGIEVRNGVPIAYSQGNFAFYFGDDVFYRHVGYLLHLDFAGCELAGFRLVPYLVGPGGLTRMTGDARRRVLEDLRQVSEVLARPEDVLAAWDGFIDHRDTGAILRALERSGASAREGSQKAALYLLNTFFTPAHREMHIRALRRAVHREQDSSPAWARELVARWNRKGDELAT